MFTIKKEDIKSTVPVDGIYRGQESIYGRGTRKKVFMGKTSILIGPVETA